MTTKFTGASLQGIVDEINRLASEPPAAAELKGIQAYLSGLFILRNSSRGALIAQLQSIDALGLGEDYLKTYVAKVNAVTPADVQKMTAAISEAAIDDHRGGWRQVEDHRGACSVRSGQAAVMSEVPPRPATSFRPPGQAVRSIRVPRAFPAGPDTI